MGELPHFGKGNFPIARKFRAGYFPHMTEQHRDAFVRGLKIIMTLDQWKMKPLSLAAGMGESAVRDLFRNESSPKVANAVALAKAVGRSVDEIVQIGTEGMVEAVAPSVAVAGRVGAGAQVDLVDAYAKGDGLYHIACPPQVSPHGIVGVEVRGDSMAPIYQPGDVLLYTRDTLGVPSEAIGKICICEDEDGRAWVKVVRTGSQEGTFSLISVNPESAHMHGVRLKWAAPVRLHPPAEFVTKVG